MTATTPDPLVPADTDVRGYKALPLDVTRLLTSETWITATLAERGAMTSLWAASWQQVPAGSLPDNDRVLAHLSMAGAEWPSVKAMCLQGWVKCADGRLYHPVVCEKAIEAISHRQQRADAAAKRWKKRDGSDGKPAEIGPESAPPVADLPSECGRISGGNAAEMHPTLPILTLPNQESIEADASTDSTEIDPPLGQDPKPASANRQDLDEQFSEWWASVPRKASKGQAEKAYRSARKHASHADLLAGIRRYAVQVAGSDPQFVKHPATWLNGKCWLDEPPPEKPNLIGDFDGPYRQNHRGDQRRFGNGFAAAAALAHAQSRS